MENLTILIPIYNEEDNLSRLYTELNAYIEIASLPTNALLINDGSTDKSKQLIKEICKKNTKFKAIHFKKNYGLSAALKAGFDNVNTTYVAYMDADLQTSPFDFEKLLYYRNEFELVTGIRANRKDSWIKKLSGKIANKIRRLFTKDGMEDTGCPLKIIRTSYAKEIPMFRGLHRFLPAMILLQNGKVKQIPVQHYPRLAGEAKFGLRNRLIGPFIDCFAYLWMKKKYIQYEIEEES